MIKERVKGGGDGEMSEEEKGDEGFKEKGKVLNY